MSQPPPLQNPNEIIDMALVRQRMQAAAAEALNASLLILSSTIRTMLSQPGTGQQYVRNPSYRRGRNLRARGVHVASAPGRPPAVDTNRLRASFSVSAVSANAARVGSQNFVAKEQMPSRTVLRFGSKVPYAIYLEYGTRRMRKRPFIAPSLEKFRPRLIPIFAVAFKRHFPKVGR